MSVTHLFFGFLLAGLAVAAAAQSGGTATGTLTINGKDNALKYAYVIPGDFGYDAKSKDTLVVLTDVPLGPFDLEDPFVEKDLGKAGQLHGVTIHLTPENHAATAWLYDQAFGEATVTLSGNIRYTPKTFNARTVSGKVELAPDELSGVSFAFSASFDAPRYQRPAPTSVGAAAVQSGPGKAMTAFLTAARAKDKAALLQLVTGSLADMLNGPQSNEVLGALAESVPPGMKVLKVTEIGDAAMVEVGTKTATEQESKLVRINGVWKLPR